MNYPWKNLSPKDGFKVRQNGLLSDMDQKILTFLYQPLIGATAYSLYMTLWTEVEDDKYWSDGILHSELLALLNIGIPELYQARIKLEAIGLLKTYVSSEQEKNFVYELLSPQPVHVFFKDDLLSLLLFEKVGEQKFRKLRQRFTSNSVNPKEFEEITKSFLDVYHFDSQLFNQEKNLLTEPVELVGATESTVPQLDSKQFDFKFFYDGLSTQYINRSSITKEIEKTIIVLNTMYGVDELKMQKAVLEASDIDTGKVDDRKLKQLIYDQYHQTNQQAVHVKDVMEEVITTSKTKRQFRKNELKHQGFTNEDIAVIEVSETMTPYDFMTSIKEQKGGFVAKTEEWTLENLLKRANLPSSVVNILIHYVLVVRGNPTFTQNLADSIANDWSQDNVTSPERAIQKVKELYQENAAKKQKREEQQKSYSKSKPATYRNNQTSTRKETLPEWAKDDYQETEEKPMSKEEQEAFMQRIKRLEKQN